MLSSLGKDKGQSKKMSGRGHLPLTSNNYWHGDGCSIQCKDVQSVFKHENQVEAVLQLLVPIHGYLWLVSGHCCVHSYFDDACLQNH